MRPTMASPSALWKAILILWVMWSSLPMDSLLCQELGTRPSVCGTLASKCHILELNYLLLHVAGWVLHFGVTPPAFIDDSSVRILIKGKLLFGVFLSGQTTRRFVGHSKDVLSVAFSADNRQIVSGSRDKTIKLWNTLGVCKYTIQVTWFFIKHCSRMLSLSYSHKIYSNVALKTATYSTFTTFAHLYKCIFQYCRDMVYIQKQRFKCLGSKQNDLTFIFLCNSLSALLFQDDSHSEWASCVRFSPNSSNPIIVSCGWDRLVKVGLWLLIFSKFSCPKMSRLKWWFRWKIYRWVRLMSIIMLIVTLLILYFCLSGVESC